MNCFSISVSAQLVEISPSISRVSFKILNILLLLIVPHAVYRYRRTLLMDAPGHPGTFIAKTKFACICAEINHAIKIFGP